MKILKIQQPPTPRPHYEVELFNNTEEGDESDVVLSREIKDVFGNVLLSGTYVTVNRPRRSEGESELDRLHRFMTVDINDCIAYVQNIRVTTTKDNPNVGIVTGVITPFRYHDLFPDIIASKSLSFRTVGEDGKLSKVICLDVVISPPTSFIG